MKKRRAIRALACLAVVALLASCASFKDFSEEYGKIEGHMLSGGKDISTVELQSDWLVGSWELSSSVEYTKTENGAITKHTDPETTKNAIIIFGKNDIDNVSVDGTEQLLNSWIQKTFGRKDEKQPITAYSLRTNAEHTIVVMTKVETVTAADKTTKDSYVYARTMVRVPSTISRTITFQSDGGTKVSSQSVPLGDKATAPADPTKDGKVFGGWYNGNNAYDFSVPVAKEMTLTAKWNDPAPVPAPAPQPAPKAEQVPYTPVETYTKGFFETRFFYSQCKDVQWNVSNGRLNMSSPAPLYNASTSKQLTEQELGDGAYIRFAKTDENGLYSQTLYAKDGTVKAVLSKKGRICYFGVYGFLYKADQKANNAYTEYCSYFYTNKGLNKDGSTPKSSSFSYSYEKVDKDSVLETFDAAKVYVPVDTYNKGFFDTRFFYSQCKDVQWNVSNGRLNMSSPAPLYNATTSRQLSEEELGDGAYIKFAKTSENGLYSQTLYAKDGTVKAVLSKKGRIFYFGVYGFLYKADQKANNAYTEYCSYFYTNKGLNADGSTPKSSSFSYSYEKVDKDSVLETFDAAKVYVPVDTYIPGFFDTRFFFTQCKDVKWNVSGGKLNMNDPQRLYNATTSRQLSEADLADGAYIRFAKTKENGFYSQTLYAKDGTVKAVLSKKGTISYFGDYGFLYKADTTANNAYMEYCSYFYTNKGLNKDGSTPSSSSFAYKYENIQDDKILENFGK